MSQQPFVPSKFDIFYAAALSGICANGPLIQELRSKEPAIDVTKEVVAIALQIAAASLAAEERPK
jgi:hypothetical protein